MPPRRVKILYVAGLGHSGSTLLGALLGQLDGFFFAGELASVGRSLENEGLCGCGELIASCPIWRGILEAAFPSSDGSSQASQLGIDRVESRGRGVMRQRLRARGLVPASPELEESRAAFGAVLQAIAETTDSRVVVDSSKWPGYGSFLQETDGVDFYVVHLIRDPRAVANSRLKSGVRRGHVVSPRPAGFALVWDVWNTIIELVWSRGQYARLRYEDFAARPEDAVRRLAALVGERPSGLPFVSADRVELAATHSAAGNRNRFQTGEVRIKLDDEWRSAERFGAADRRAVAALTWPLRIRYGYAGSGRGSGAAAS